MSYSTLIHLAADLSHYRTDISGRCRAPGKAALFGRHQLRDDNALGRPGWNDLRHLEAAAL